MEYAFTFPSGTVRYLFQKKLSWLHHVADPKTFVVITDEHLAKLYEKALRGYTIITLPVGEEQKSLENVAYLSQELLRHHVYRQHKLLGLGGGVITDITGYLASSYMRGVEFGFVPTTLLGMVDAAVGGKNGVNLGPYKNILGTMTQPAFIYYDLSLLQTLPAAEWRNGFAEIIKYGCIADSRILNTLEQEKLAYFQQHPQALEELVIGCIDIKNKIVHADERETGIRKLLNFGHTAGHAFERQYGIRHGEAVALGMLVACMVSEKECRLEPGFRKRLAALLKQYGLPCHLEFSVEKVMELMRSDKKRNQEGIDYVLLEKPGVGIVKKLPFETIEAALQQFLNEGNC